jgi:putative membrane protein
LRRFKDYLLLYLKGVGMGAADVVPGVSGGTVAFITGIYDELLFSINAIDAEAFRLLARFRIAQFWERINGNFLIVLLAGIGTSLLSLANLMTYLLKYHPVIIWSFFFGLILISAPLVLREIKKWSVGTVLSFLVGCGIAYVITVLSPTQTPNGLWFIFIAGAIAICAMILPGISGAFILLLLGKYSYMILALTSFNLPVVLVFIAGCATGLLLFSRFLTWILKNYHSATVALLAGFMLGSLNKVWPWREVLEYVTNSEGEQVPVFDRSVLPWNYVELTGKDPQVFQAILMMALGVFIVVLIEKIAERLKTKI